MFSIFDAFKLGLGAVVGAFLAGAAVTILANISWIPEAEESARQQERAAQLQKSMELIEQRGKTNEEIRKMDDVELCTALGGRMLNNVCQ